MYCMRKIAYLFVLLFTASTLFTSCRSDEVETPVLVESVTLSPTEFSIEMGAPAVQLTATVHPANATNRTVAWLSGNENIVRVNEQGAVAAVSVGTTHITVITACGVRTNTATITVTPAPIVVTSVTLAGCTDASLAIGRTRRLTATVLPEDATNRAVTWTSSNNNFATVDNNGLVTAVATGTATITVTTADGGKTKTCVVTVYEPAVPVTDVRLNENEIVLFVGNNETLIATVAPANATNQNVTWSSSNSNIATVDNNGRVTAVALGTATITVTTENGNRRDTCFVIVTDGKTNPTQGGVIINGVEWATRNLDYPDTFAPYSHSAGRFYQWGTLNGVTHHWPATGEVRVWAGNSNRTAWTTTNDPCPQGWRVPTEIELRSLNNAESVWTQRNGVNGRLFGTAPNQIFLPAAGWRFTSGILGNAGSFGSYWSSTRTVDNARSYYFRFHSGSSSVDFTFRAQGFLIRCVAE